MSTVTTAFSEISRLIDQVSKERGIDKQIVINSIVSGLLSAVRKKYGTYRDIEVKYDENTGQLALYEFKEVVKDEKFVDDQIEVKLSEAKTLDPEAQVGDQIGVSLKSEELGRIDADMAKQIVVQSLKEAENEMVFNEFEKRKGEVVSGFVRRVDRGGMVVVDLEKIEAYIPRKEQIYGERYNPGARVQGYILEVRQTTRGPQIIMSRSHPQYLIKLFEKEVPEIYEGVVKIVSAAREPGQRAKIAVYSTDSAVHPVGACVGMKGNRVQNITQELKGERIDVIEWEENPAVFIENALAPARISKLFIDEESKEMEVVVSEDQLSLAIGKKGQNVRLAVNLTGWTLNIISTTELEEQKRQAIFNLMLVPGINETIAENIFHYGIKSIQDLVETPAKKITFIPGYETAEAVQGLIQKAQQILDQYKAEGKELPTAPPLKQKSKVSAGLEDAKSQADQELKKELAQLEAGGETDKASNKTEQIKKTEEEEDKDTIDTKNPAQDSVEKQTAKDSNQEKKKEITKNTESLEKDSIAKETSSAKPKEKAKDKTAVQTKKV